MIWAGRLSMSLPMAAMRWGPDGAAIPPRESMAPRVAFLCGNIFLAKRPARSPVSFLESHPHDRYCLEALRVLVRSRRSRASPNRLPAMMYLSSGPVETKTFLRVWGHLFHAFPTPRGKSLQLPHGLCRGVAAFPVFWGASASARPPASCCAGGSW